MNLLVGKAPSVVLAENLARVSADRIPHEAARVRRKIRRGEVTIPQVERALRILGQRQPGTAEIAKTYILEQIETEPRNLPTEVDALAVLVHEVRGLRDDLKSLHGLIGSVVGGKAS